MADSCLNCKWYNEQTKECRAEPPQAVYRHDYTAGSSGHGIFTWEYPTVEEPVVCEKYRKATPM